MTDFLELISLIRWLEANFISLEPGASTERLSGLFRVPTLVWKWSEVVKSSKLDFEPEIIV